jgi:chaperonin GroES
MAVDTAEKKTAQKTTQKTPLGFKPLKDRCFVSYTEELERTAGGIYVPDVAKEKPQRGKVEAIGADVKSVKVADLVLFDKYSGSKINVDGTDYLIIKEEDILGIFET